MDKLVCGIELVRQHGEAPKFQGPLLLRVIFHIPQVSNHSRRKKANKPLGSVSHSVPDLSNYLKFLEDVITDTDVIFNTDDRQIGATIMIKIFGHPARTELILSEMNQEDTDRIVGYCGIMTKENDNNKTS